MKMNPSKLCLVTLVLGSVAIGCSPAITEPTSVLTSETVSQDCLSSSADRSLQKADDLNFVSRQEVRWLEEDHDIYYKVSLTAVQDQTIGVRLRILNLGTNDALIMTETRWIAGYTEDSISISLGNSAGNYGNEIPALQILGPGTCYDDFDILEIGGAPASFIEAVEVGFFGIFGDVPALKNQLEGLSEVQGWWQTNDLNLTDRYYEHLAYPMVSFTLAADSPILSNPSM